MSSTNLLHIALPPKTAKLLDEICDERRGKNPKLRNLTKLERSAAEEIIRKDGKAAGRKYISSLDRVIKEHRFSRTVIGLEMMELGIKHNRGQ